MVKTYQNGSGIQYRDLDPASSRETWLREVADAFFERNEVTNRPDIFTFSDKNKSSHAHHPAEPLGNLIGKETPNGRIAIRDSDLDRLYAKRNEGAAYALEWLLGHEYHHTVHNNRTWKNSEKFDVIVGLGGAIAGAVAGAMASLNIPKIVSIPPKISAAIGTMFGFLAGSFLGERRSSRFDEARADLTANKMLLNGRNADERKVAMEKASELEVSHISKKSLLDNPLVNLMSKHPTGGCRLNQHQLIAQETDAMASNERLETIFQTVDQNLISAARNPLQFAIHYG